MDKNAFQTLLKEQYYKIIEMIGNTILEHNQIIEMLFNNLSDELSSLKLNLVEKDKTITQLQCDIKDHDFNQSNYQNFSLVSNLSKQIKEKELELKTYQSQLRTAKKEIEMLKDKLEILSERDEIEDPRSVQLMIEEVENTKLTSTTTIETTTTHVEENIMDETNQNELVEDKNNQTKETEETEETEATLEKEESEETIEKEESEETVEEEEEEEQEISYIRKKIKGKYYYVSDEDPPQIYECLEDNEVGSLVGKMNDKKAEFY
jgi:hypothetical protein